MYVYSPCILLYSYSTLTLYTSYNEFNNCHETKRIIQKSNTVHVNFSEIITTRVGAQTIIF